MKILHDFHDIRNASLDPGGRDDIPRPRRARGGKIEMRSAGGADVDRDQPRRSKRRAAGERGRKASDAVSGAPVKHRADRRTRSIQKRADGGYTGPYSGASGYVPASAPIAPGRFTAPAVPNQPDYTSQMINAIGTWNKGDSKDGGQGLIGSIKMPGGGTLGDATQDFFQDLGDWRGGAVRKRGGQVRGPQDISPKRGGRVQQHHQRKGKTR